MKQNSYRILLALCATLLTAALTASVATSSPGENERAQQQKAPTTERAADSPRVLESSAIAVDPETGEAVTLQGVQKIGALSAQLANALNRSTEGLRVFELENGGRGMHLEGRFQHALVARVKEDGSLEIVCINHPHEAEALLKRRSTPADRQPLDK